MIVSRGAAWIFAALVIGGVALWQFSRPSSALTTLPVLDTLGGDFTLSSTLGRPISLSGFRGQVVLLNFGYTGCPDVCPTALARMRDVLAMLGEDRAAVQPLFITLDPEADSVERLRPYVRFFDSRLIGMTGSAEEIAAAAEPYKVYYVREPGPAGAGYSISHSSHIYLLDASGRVRATFGEGVRVETMARAVEQLIREAVDQRGEDFA